MLRTLATTALCSAVLIGPSAYAADNPMLPANPAAQTQSATGVNFVTSQATSQ